MSCGLLVPVSSQPSVGAVSDCLLDVFGAGPVSEIGPYVMTPDVISVKYLQARRTLSDECQGDEPVHAGSQQVPSHRKGHLEVTIVLCGLDEGVAPSDAPNKARVRGVVVALKSGDRTPLIASRPMGKSLASDESYPVVLMADLLGRAGLNGVDVGSQASVSRAGNIGHASLLARDQVRRARSGVSRLRAHSCLEAAYQ